MSERFQRPTDIIRQQDQFGGREVGLTHPDQPSHLRIRDNGDIELIAGDGLGIVMNLARRSITFMADQVKFLTSEDNGLRWNKLSFNPKATEFHQPAFVPFLDTHSVDLYKGTEHYMPTSAETAYGPFYQNTGTTDV